MIKAEKVEVSDPEIIGDYERLKLVTKQKNI